MKVYIIGSGPGAADLITVRGAKLIEKCQLIMYAGSLVNREILKYANQTAKVVNTAGKDLDQQVQLYREAQKKGWNVSRIHSGDPSIYGAVAEQMKHLDILGISYEIIPGVSSFSACAALINKELTKPGVSQTLILTRLSGKASQVPKSESIEALGSHKATLCVFLSGHLILELVEKLLPIYGPETPISLIQKASWKKQKVHESTLGYVLNEIDPKDWILSTLVFVGEVLKNEMDEESKLYSPNFSHKFRKAK